MFYQGSETIMFFKDDESDVNQYKSLNLELMKSQGWKIEENKNFYLLKRILHLQQNLPIIDAGCKEMNKEENAE